MKLRYKGDYDEEASLNIAGQSVKTENKEIMVSDSVGKKLLTNPRFESVKDYKSDKPRKKRVKGD